MKKLKVLMFAILSFLFITGVAFSYPSTALQNVLNNITAPYPGVSSIDVSTDFINDASDSYWSISGSGQSAATMIIELAGYANNNIFGVYNNGYYVPLFAGSASVPTAKAVLSILLDGSVEVNFVDTGIDFSGNSFGYYLQSPEGIFHSDTALNQDGFDHMYAYQGLGLDTIQVANLQPGVWSSNEYILAFEDLYGGGDQDFTDMVVIVESVSPVPEPATMMLLGLGLLGLAGVSRKRR